MTDVNVRIDCVTNSKYPPCDACECDVSTEVLAGDNVIVDQTTPTSVTVSAGVLEISQAGNGFAIGTPIYFDGTWHGAIANSFATSGTHVVSRTGDPEFRAVQTGVVDFGIPHGFPIGSLLYVSPNFTGTFTTTNPTAPYFSNPLAKVLTAETIEVFSYKSEIGIPPLQIFLNPIIGNDANDGLTVGNPVQTLAAAVSKFGTNTSGPSNRTATITLSAGTVNLGASPTLDITPLANVGFSQLIIIGNTTVNQTGNVTATGPVAPAQQFSALTTDQLAMPSFRGQVLVNTTDNTDSVVETNTVTTFTIPDGRNGNLIGFQPNDAFSVITHNTTLTWTTGSVIITSTRSIQLKLRHLIITAAGAVTDTIYLRRPSGNADAGAVLLTVTGCSLNTAAHNAMFTGYEMNFVGCLASGAGFINGNFVDHTARFIRVFLTNAGIVPVNGISGGIYSLTQSMAMPIQNNSSVFGLKLENGNGTPLTMVQIFSANVRIFGLWILGNTVLMAFGVLLRDSTLTMCGMDINGNNALGRGLSITRGSLCRIGHTLGGVPNNVANCRDNGIEVFSNSKLDTGIATVLTSTVINGPAGFGVALASGGMFTFSLTPTITGGAGDCGLGASGARTWAQVAGGLAANVNDFAAASPQNVVAITG